MSETGRYMRLDWEPVLFRKDLEEKGIKLSEKNLSTLWDNLNVQHDFHFRKEGFD
jgi:hypothetical protein